MICGSARLKKAFIKCAALMTTATQISAAALAVRKALAVNSIIRGVLLTCAFVVMVSLSPPAQAVPTGSTDPATWTITNPGTSSTGAIGTIPGSPVTVTVTVTAPLVIAGNGRLILANPYPAYFPVAASTMQALQFQITAAAKLTYTVNLFAGCGTVTYAFSSPVLNPVRYIGDVEAALVGTTNSYRDLPWLLLAGHTFSFESAGSQSSSVSIQKSTS